MFSAAAIELNTDFLAVDPAAFINDQSNKLVKGRIISQTYEYYYGICISCTMSAQKSDPGSFLMFYEAPTGKNEEFYSFFKDYINQYLGRAFCTCVSASLANDETELDYFIYIDNELPVIIYAKYSPSIGIRGFGITYENYKSGVARKSERAFINAAFYGEKKTKLYQTLDVSEMENNYAYLINCDINCTIEWCPCNDDVVYENVISKSFVMNNDSDKGGSGFIIIEIICDDEKLKSDPSFLCSYFELSNGLIVTVKEIIDRGNKYLVFGAKDIVGIRYYLNANTEVIDLLEKHVTVKIYPEDDK